MADTTMACRRKKWNDNFLIHFVMAQTNEREKQEKEIFVRALPFLFSLLLTPSRFILHTNKWMEKEKRKFHFVEAVEDICCTKNFMAIEKFGEWEAFDSNNKNMRVCVSESVEPLSIWNLNGNENEKKKI